MPATGVALKTVVSGVLADAGALPKQNPRQNKSAISFAPIFIDIVKSILKKLLPSENNN